MLAELDGNHLTLTAKSPGHLRGALELAFRLNGEPERWTQVDDTMVVIGQIRDEEGLGIGLNPFLGAITPTGLGVSVWEHLAPTPGKFIIATILLDGQTHDLELGKLGVRLKQQCKIICYAKIANTPHCG